MDRPERLRALPAAMSARDVFDMGKFGPVFVPLGAPGWGSSPDELWTRASTIVRQGFPVAYRYAVIAPVEREWQAVALARAMADWYACGVSVIFCPDEPDNEDSKSLIAFVLTSHRLQISGFSMPVREIALAPGRELVRWQKRWDELGNRSPGPME